MVPALTLLVYWLTQVPAIQLLPWYVAAYLLIGACIFGPAGKLPSLRLAVAFLLPGVLLVVRAVLDYGFWCGGWLLALPAWGRLLSRWTAESTLLMGQVLKLLGSWVLGLVIFAFTGFILVFFGLTVFLLPFIPLIRLRNPAYRGRPTQATVEILLAMAAVVVAVALPTPEGAYSAPWMYSGGAATAGLMIAYWASRIPDRSSRVRSNSGVIL
ncbi:hypothetical protein DAD99_20895 [Pseudarthrobacter sp. AB1]|nr:hypothetical protein [Pseudarthrobacter sp. AB1]